MSEQIFERIKQRLHKLYPLEQAKDTYQELNRLIQICGIETQKNNEQWTQQDVVLISYGDSLLNSDTSDAPLKVLQQFLNTQVKDVINTLHILPFFPYSSDDGFSVIDYVKVDPDLGDWSDVAAISQGYRLMVDLVINHISRESLWFTDYKADVAPFNQFFIEMPRDADVSQVVRPRNSPLLVPAYTHRGRKYVWATFSADQIDLNFENPAVLIKMIEVLLFYIKQKTHILRLDAIAFLWKKLGTDCIHLPQTHEVVKLIRDVFELVSPSALVLTETNVPHTENLSYFGEGDEAHMVYQFSLAPLVLHALYRANGSYLTRWAQQLSPPPSGCTFLNFTASHDGIGLRPVEGILPEHEIQELINGMHRQGGYVSMRSRPDGSESPYEINIALFSAFREIAGSLDPDQWQVERFICSQMIMLTLQGIPALYIHSLLATVNDQTGVERTGRTRSINRRKWEMSQLQPLLDAENSPNARVLKRLISVLKKRKKHKAFHPDSAQKVLDVGADFFVVWRGLGELDFPLLAVFNLTNQVKTLEYPFEQANEIHQDWVDLLEKKVHPLNQQPLSLQPYQVLWLMPAQVNNINPLWAMQTA
ncbi:sugar phosphorylase [Thiomicrospira microaerophila]|uniref:sugar phosphorylase n=1 Tax=Thiomicrospira microaerophila TaxID=406020 RepID=UPI00200FA5BB|nr:sugar phosphorylase [Thiomicrospira microaerophila]UQB42398.1 sugar phosphorylase [Thiomicrospira microaerophila]